MEQDRLDYLLRRTLNKEATVEERLEMQQLMEDPAREKEVKELLYACYEQPKALMDLIPQKRDHILQAIFQSVPTMAEEIPVRKLRMFKWQAAAAILFALLSIGVYFMFVANPVGLEQTAGLQQNDIGPGKNRATLTLSDGSVITLDDALKGTIASQSGLKITKNAEGQIVYEVNRQEDESTDGFNTITTPYGGHYDVLLQDGSKVSLNAGSSITYPLSFKKGTRKVTLIGEAYFEVARDKARPFIVATPAVNGIMAQEIQVLGTHFNVCAYADEKSYVTTLLEGSVKVSTENNPEGKILKPGEQATVRNAIRLSSADTEAAIAWKNGVFHFMDQPIENIMRQISRWYDVEISYRGTVPTIGFWVQISRKKKLSEVLESLEETNGVHFKIEGRRVIVMP